MFNHGFESDRLGWQPRILRIITRLNIGGPAIHATLLARRLPERGYESLLAIGECESDEGDMSYLLGACDSVRRIPELSRSISPLRSLRAVFRLWKVIRAERPHIVHTHTAMAGAVGRVAALLAGVPVIVHTFHGNSLRHYFSPAANRVFVAIERLLARRTDAICVISPQQLHELCDELRIAARSRFRVVPLGLDLSQYLGLAAPEPSRRIRIGWFGRLVSIKNIGLLLETISMLKRCGCPAEFHIAGDGPDRTLLETALPCLGDSVVWYGWQHDILPILAKCDVVIQTSRNEGTPVALIQAMAAGRPFVSTAVGGVVDMTTGKARALTPEAAWFNNAVLVNPNAEAFRNVIVRIAQDPQCLVDMGEAARAFASRHYRGDELLSNLDIMYRELLETKLRQSHGVTVQA
jgi:glycosyltransferase involved in cell wall biosynthesis